MKQRIELGIYTNNTTLGSTISVDDVYNFAKEQNMAAIAVTDLNSVQSFPEFGNWKNRQYGIKPIFGAKIVHSDYHSDYFNISTVLVKNQVGLKNLYHIMSELKHKGKGLYSPISIMEKYHEGLLFGYCEIDGPAYISYFYKDFEYYGCYNDFFDYFEIKNYYDNDYERDANKQIVALAKKINKPVVAVSDARYIEKEDEICIKILQNKGNEEVENTKNSYLRTIEEMLNEFSYLGEDVNDVVIENTHKIANMLDDIELFPFPLKYNMLDNAYDIVKQVCYDFIADKYGDNPPKEVTERLETELGLPTAIDFADVFLLSANIVRAAKVNSEFAIPRADTASSFISYCLGITEINPLPPHYYCPNCKKIEWVSHVYSGYDLPYNNCTCGSKMQGDGQNICYQSFFGYSGDKVPDIDLNFSSHGRNVVINSLKNIILDKEQIVLGGCTGSVVNEYSPLNIKKCIKEYEDKTENSFSEEEKQNIFNKIECTKAFDDINESSLMIIPKNKEIYDFTPIRDGDFFGFPVTHYSFNELWDFIYNCDIFVFPFVEQLKLLERKTDADICNIPLNGIELIELIKNADLSGIKCFEEYDIPSVIKSVEIRNFTDLSKLLGLYFRMGEMQGDCESALKSGRIKLSEIPAYREDIYFDLLNQGMDKWAAFQYMEIIHKGRIANNYSSDDDVKKFENDLTEIGMPQWYIDYCKHTRYLFPKAHGAEYTRVAVIQAWYKVHFREIFEEVRKETC